jgi:tRNA 2-selenouridine synthase SelU
VRWEDRSVQYSGRLRYEERKHGGMFDVRQTNIRDIRTSRQAKILRDYLEGCALVVGSAKTRYAVQMPGGIDGEGRKRIGAIFGSSGKVVQGRFGPWREKLR